MDIGQHLSDNRRIQRSFVGSRVEEISDEDFESPNAVPKHGTKDQTFVLVRQNPQKDLTVQDGSSRADNSTGLEQILMLGENNQAMSTGLEASLPAQEAQRRTSSRPAPAVLPFGSRVREPLPSWSDIPRNQQMDLRLIARNFELIDRLLSACIYSKEVLAGLVQTSSQEQFAPGLDSAAVELAVARFRLVCKEKGQQNLTKDDGMFRVSMVMTSQETQRFFYHASEELQYYLASQYDLPYWKVVLKWLAATYGTKDSSYDFVRLIVYALESLHRSIQHDFQTSSIRNEAGKPVVDGINRRLEALNELLDDAFPKKLQRQMSNGASASNLITITNGTRPVQAVDSKFSKNSKQEQNPTITGLILVSTIITIPFVGLGWAASDKRVGQVDSNFWFLIPSMLIQLIGVFVVAKPLWRESALNAAWAWVWVWLGITGIASVASVVFYVTLPSEWSLFASYLAAAAQSLLSVQLIFAIPEMSKT